MRIYTQPCDTPNRPTKLDNRPQTMNTEPQRHTRAHTGTTPGSQPQSRRPLAPSIAHDEREGASLMPHAAPTRCPVPGCHQLTTERGRCATHQRKAWENPSANTRALTPRQRQQFHDAVLEREPTCRVCGAPATEADHITPIALGGAHTDPANGQGLCETHHNDKTTRDRAAIRAARKAPRR